MNTATPFELEYNDSGDKITTSIFQLLQWKHALNLEKVGMTLSRGQKVSTHLRKVLKLKRNTPISYLHEWVTGALAAATGEGPER
jgi:hypothetical protein